MAKDYFQDITPPGDFEPARTPSPRPIVPDPGPVHDDLTEDNDTIPASEANPVRIRVDDATQPTRPSESPNRGIRNISAPLRPRSRIGADMREAPPVMSGLPPRPRRRVSRVWIWAAAIVGLLVVIGLFLFAFRATTVTVTPKSETITLTGPGENFTAYPAATAASSTLTYTVQTSDLDDSEVVPSTGTTTAPAAKASGNITVINNYSASSIDLVKNTRFQTQGGLIFRTPNDIVIPGKTAAGPGQVQVTVIADATGDQYNIGPTARFTVPGLQSNASEYANVYAKSTASMSGGSSGGDAPGIAPAALSAAIAEVDARLASKARDAAVAQESASTFVLPDLMQITYQSEPNTTEAGGVRIHESAHIVTPLFPAGAFAQTVAQTAIGYADTATLTLVPGSGFSAQMATSSTAVVGTDPIEFSLSGVAQLVWTIDTGAIASALAGRDQGAFQTVINSFEGIQEAHARIEPFWKSTFPANASDIKITVTAPASAQ